MGTAEEKVVKIQRRLLFHQKIEILIKSKFQKHLINNVNYLASKLSTVSTVSLSTVNVVVHPLSV